MGYYEWDATDGYTLTDDTSVTAGKTYFQVVSGSVANVDAYATMTVAASEANVSTGTYTTRITLSDATGIKAGDIVAINYCYSATVETAKIDNQQTFVGEAILRWPVYSSGEEVKAAGVKGYCMMHIYKCRCTAMPGFDTSYKSAVTNGITVSAMDPHRPDGAIYSMSFVEK